VRQRHPRLIRRLCWLSLFKTVPVAG
jgi:hypothetical protein